MTKEPHVAQAEFWRDKITLDGTWIAPGTRLLEIGCGTGAVLGILGDAFPGLRLSGIDQAPERIALAKRHLGERGLRADLRAGDAAAIPFPDGAFDHVWIQFVLEHLRDPVGALREALRVLAPGGTITVIEVDYQSLRATPATPELDAFLFSLELGMAAVGQSRAGANAARWLVQAGFDRIEPGKRLITFEGDSTHSGANYLADAVQDVVSRFATVPGTASAEVMRRGIADLRQLATFPGARFEAAFYKASGHARSHAAAAAA